MSKFLDIRVFGPASKSVSATLLSLGLVRTAAWWSWHWMQYFMYRKYRSQGMSRAEASRLIRRQLDDVDRLFDEGVRWPENDGLIRPPQRGVYEPPLEPVPAAESIAVRRIAPGEHDVAELGRTSLLVDAVTGSVDILLRFPTGPSYAARLGDDLARRLVPALELATDALLPLIEQDLKSHDKEQPRCG